MNPRKALGRSSSVRITIVSTPKSSTFRLEFRFEVAARACALFISILVAWSSFAIKRSGRPGFFSSLLQRCGNNFVRKTQILAEIVDAFICKVPIVPLPIESFANIAFGLEGDKKL